MLCCSPFIDSPYFQQNKNRGREVLVGFAGSAFFGMIVMLTSKELAADIAIQVC